LAKSARRIGFKGFCCFFCRLNPNVLFALYDLLVIGGGIVGMATALRLKQSRPHLKVCVMEEERNLAQHQTGHNSGVIHSGIYYKPGSLKALNCIRGYQQLLAFCDAHQVPYKLCGKLIVATSPQELSQLETIYQRGLANGLDKVRKLDSLEDLKGYEPHVNGIAGLHVPYTGIIDYAEVTRAYGKAFTQLEGEVFVGIQVLGMTRKPGHVVLETNAGEFKARKVINCAGLYSDEVAAMVEKQLQVRIIPFRGEYYELRPEKQYLVKTLIYPVPDPHFPFLGVHFTNMIQGGVEAGPNAVLAFRKEGYRKTDFSFRDVSRSLAWPGFGKVMLRYWQTGLGEYYRSFSKTAFTKALQKLVPELQEEDLIPGGAGVRAQACDKTGGLVDDFLILQDAQFVHVCNASSPAATSSLSIGQTVAQMALQSF
jgi:L-2-hydroxyglutarate oxidase